MKVKVSSIALCTLLAFLIGAASIQAAPERALGETKTFAMGGIGFAGVMSEGERALREILKDSDATRQLESLLPDAPPAGQLYALLGLRLRDRAAYQRALEKYGTKDAKVPTMRGCILQRESFDKLVNQIKRGDYDSFLEREWPKHTR